MSARLRFLVPVDFSDGSADALKQALMLAAPLDAQVDVLHVWGPPPHAKYERGATADAVQEAGSEAARQRVEPQMQAFLQRLDLGEPRRLEARYAAGDSAAEAILEIADVDNYDMIVMGTHGHSGLKRLVLGSVAEQVVRRATCPVLTVRALRPLAIV